MPHSLTHSLTKVEPQSQSRCRLVVSLQSSLPRLHNPALNPNLRAAQQGPEPQNVLSCGRRITAVRSCVDARTAKKNTVRPFGPNNECPFCHRFPHNAPKPRSKPQTAATDRQQSYESDTHPRTNRKQLATWIISTMIAAPLASPKPQTPNCWER